MRTIDPSIEVVEFARYNCTTPNHRCLNPLSRRVTASRRRGAVHILPLPRPVGGLGGSGLTRNFADLAEHYVGPSDVVQPHHYLTTQASQQSGVTSSQMLGQKLERSTLRLRARVQRPRRAGIGYNLDRPRVAGDGLRPRPDANRVQVLQSRGADQSHRPPVGNGQPLYGFGFPEAVGLRTVIARPVSRVSHASHATVLIGAFCTKPSFSRLIVRYFGFKLMWPAGCRAQDSCERTNETHN